MERIRLYTDGGVIRANPSPIGGTWAWCLVDVNDERTVTGSGVLTPEMVGGPVSNNVTELAAMVYGIEACPSNRSYPFTVCSDSWITLQRVFLAARLKNVPPWLVRRLHYIQKSGRLSGVEWQLLSGHPTKAQLASGVGRRGTPVSAHNVWCDAQCNAAAAQFLKECEVVA